MSKFRYKENVLYVRGKAVLEGEAVVRALGELALNQIPAEFKFLELDEQDLEDIEFILTHEIYEKGEEFFGDIEDF